jgi:hypothetical protein
MAAMRVRLKWIVLAGLLLIASCTKIPPPTQEEFYARDQWAMQVTEDDRKTVFDETHMHTGWSEKRKVLYELDRFQRIARNEERNGRWEDEKKHNAATQAATTRSSTRPSSRPTTRRRSTKTGTGAPGDTEE